MPTFTGWSGGFEAPFDREVTPDSLGALVAAVASMSVQEGDRVHAQGSKWAFSAPAYCANTIINTDLLCNFPSAIQSAIEEPFVEGRMRIAVEAGIKVYDLYNALAGRNGLTGTVPDRRFGGGTITSLSIDRDRWMLPALGGAGGQSIAGVINTGTHGGDARRPPLSDAVAAMLTVGTGGQLRLLQRRPLKQHPPVVNAARLASALGMEVQDIQDDEMLQAAVVSVGRFGVVYAYVLEAVDEGSTRIIEKRTRSDWRAQRGNLVAKVRAAAIEDQFLQIVINPNRRADGDHTCYVTTHTMVPESSVAGLMHVWEARRASGFMEFFQLLCADRVTPEIEAARNTLVGLIPALAPTLGLASVLLPPPFNTLGALLPLTLPVLIGLIAATIDRLGRIGPGYLIGDAIADTLNAATDAGFPILGEFLTGMLLEGEQRDWTVWGTRFEVADFFDYEHDCYRGDSVEVFFEVNDELPEKIDRLLDIFDELKRDGKLFGGYFSLRFMAQSGALLGLSPWSLSCSAEIAAIRGLRGTMEALGRAQQVAVENGGLVHWGQQHDLDEPIVTRSYGASLTLWRRKLAEIEGTSLLFSTPFTVQRGLEVPIEILRGADVWSDWERLGAVSARSPGVADAGFDQPLEIFAVDDRNTVVSRKRFTDRRTPPGWSPVLPDPAPGQPIVIRGGSGRLELFVTDALAQRIKHTWEMSRPGGTWARWDTLGSGAGVPIESDPSVALHVDKRLEVFALAGRVDGLQRLAHSWAHWVDGPWADVMLRGSSVISTPPSVCHRNLDSDQIVAVSAASDGRVMVIQQIGPGGDSPWTEWIELIPSDGLTLRSPGDGGPVIVIASGAGATTHVLAMDRRGNLHESTDLLTGLRLSWSPWQPLPSAAYFDFVATDCRLATLVTDRLYVFARSQHNQVLEIEFVPGFGWSSWRSLGGHISGDIAAGYHNDSRVEIVVKGGVDGELRARRQTAPGVW